jgi:predicted O-methyltransferase YrrM
VIRLLAFALFLAALGFAARQAYRALVRRRRRRAEDLLGRPAIPPLRLHELDELFRTGPFGPELGSEVHFIGRGGIEVPGGTTDSEAWILAVLAKRAHRMFEFGTCTGKTAYLWARNSPPDAVVTTLTLAPEHAALYRADPHDTSSDREHALAESRFQTFLYSDTEVEPKIVQLFGDSKQLDETPFLGKMDLIFIDGSHAYSYVQSDSEKALRMIRPGGLILWHDYRGPLGGKGTDRALIELAQRLPLRHIAGTEIVAYRAPEAPQLRLITA